MASSKSVKFEISIEKLVVKFEGDVEIAERIQGDVTTAIASLTAAQKKLLGPGQSASNPTQPAAEQQRGGRRRRRRRGWGGDGIDPSVLDGDVSSSEGDSAASNGNGASGERREVGAATLIETLRAEGFFSQKRKLGDIRAKMAEKGHTLAPTDISPALVKATRKGSLQREKDNAKQWVYFTS